MSTAPNSPNSRTGAVPVGGGRNRRKWLLPLLLGLLAVIALLALLSQCGDDDDAAGPTGTPTSATAPVSTAATSAPTTSSLGASGPTSSGQSGTDQTGEQGTVTAAGTNLLSAATPADLGTHDGQPAVGRAVKVQSVPADEGFWVGASEQDRLWVQLTGTGGESDYKVKQGDTVNFTGILTKAAQGFAAKTGVTAAEGADQLTQQGYYVSAPSSSIKLSR